MPNLITQIATQLPQPTLSAPLQSAGETLRILVEAEAYAGELVSLGYSEALEQIHDHHRQKLGGYSRPLLSVGDTGESADDARCTRGRIIGYSVARHGFTPICRTQKKHGGCALRMHNA